jgi:hypothetical protein
MESIHPRKLIFKAWDKSEKLLMRLNSIDCKKGELFKKDCILLQFTGLYDKQEEEIFEMDLLLINSEKYIVVWDAERNGWNLALLSNPKKSEPFLQSLSVKTSRLCSFYESERK